MIICNVCGRSSEQSYSGKCQCCYDYFKRGGVINDLPRNGEIATDIDGKIICHVCGRSFNKLGAHVYMIHGFTEKQYKEKFGLNRSSSLSSKDLIKKCRDNIYNNYNVIETNLIEGGKETRVSAENKIRLGVPDRLQSIYRRKGIV